METDLEFIKNFMEWPYYPYLPIKRRVQGKSWPECATLIHDDVIKVYRTSIDNHEFDNCETIIYSSIEEMIEDGWMVD